MRNVGVFACGTTTSIYEMNKDEFVPWHKHSNMHGHYVLRGRTRIEVDGLPDVEMDLTKPNLELPPNIWHKITALEDDTIFLHISIFNKDDTTELKDAI